MRTIIGLIPVVLILIALGAGIVGQISDGGDPRERIETPPDQRQDRQDPRHADKGRVRIGEKQQRRPDPGNGRRNPGGRELPDPSNRDPAVNVEIPVEAQNSQGTAFSIDARGVWMTARHVADSCDQMYVMTGPRQGIPVRNVYIHPSADLAILRTNRGAPPFAITPETLRISQDGYHFGFPSGEPAAVSSRLLGRAVMRVSGRYRTREPVVAWAEQVRVPDSQGGLQGISGGPAVDANGRLIGVTVAGSRRRGRVYTTALVSMHQALRRARASIDEAGQGRPGSVDGRNFAQVGAGLRQSLSVARVVCLVRGSGRRGRRGK